MGLTLSEKIIKAHLVEGSLEAGGEIGLRIDQTLTQDSTGTMAYLQYEALGIPRVKTELSVAYIDHNILQTGFENADDHEYIRTVAKKYGIRFSRPGNGICHHVHLERFARPGKTLIGSDSHTPTAGGIGSLAFGAGGLDVAVAMGGGTYYITAPKVTEVRLHGSLGKGVAAKDIILELLKILSVKGGVGRIIEYTGDGVASLTVPERATITNMGAELGATTSIFPSDENTRLFLAAEGREQDYVPLSADPDAVYDKTVEIDLSSLVPLAACPHMPDIVKPVGELAGQKLEQVCIGSCTNSSLHDMLTVAAILKGKTVHDGVSLTISPGSRQVLTMLSQCGALDDILSAGARVLECACGPCIGMGQSPASGAVSLRTFNRNFEGRSGTADAKVYLVSPETAAVSALTGVFTDPREVCAELDIIVPERFYINDNMVDMPAGIDEAADVNVRRGPNIKPFPLCEELPESISYPVSLKVGDNITTDHIMPAGAKILPYRSNIPYMSNFCFMQCDADFHTRAAGLGRSIIVGGENYGQGSSREHAALVPLYLGVRAVIVKSFARIHRDNLVNTGILPLLFTNPTDYDRIAEGDVLELTDLHNAVEQETVKVFNKTKNESYTAKLDLSERQRRLLRYGGVLGYTKHNA